VSAVCDIGITDAAFFTLSDVPVYVHSRIYSYIPVCFISGEVALLIC